MTRYLIRRLILLAFTLLVTSIIIFALTQLLPGDIARLILGRDASPVALEEFRVANGLDQPIPMQYVSWLTNFLRGDWGNSYDRGNFEIYPHVMTRLENSLRLAIYTLLIAVPTAILLGIIAALRRDGLLDSLISIGTLAVVGLPEFVTAIILINVLGGAGSPFSSTALVSSDMAFSDWIRILTLPALTATFVLLAYITRMTRAGVIDEMNKQYVRTAILKGLPPRVVIFKHVLRNALLPTITVIAISTGWLIGGLVVVEQVFNYPGLGRELVQAVKSKNIPLIQALVIITVFFYAFSNLLADLVYGLLNPRIRYE
ncbi:MAG: ABC transporter permease [Anaerolineae bacterium]|jgi:peptide/nickel transport system permease protein|nr:ABC transporter permease [Anaerolineae bacterium]